MEEKKNLTGAELNEERLGQVNGGAINIFYDMPKNPEYWKYTCRVCGNIGIVLGYPEGCFGCGSTDVKCELYKA